MTKTKMTLSAIAKQADVSIASVSRVLNTPHLTSWAIQSRVHKAVSLLSIDVDYIFKPYSTAHSSKKILILDNQLITQNLINYGLEKKFKQENYQIFYFRFPYNKKRDIQQLIHYVAQNAFDGIIIINDAPYLKKLNDYAYALPPIILVNHFSLDFPSVYFDHLMIAHQMTTYLLNSSHTRISILLSHHDKTSSIHLLHGYQQALLRANLQIEENYIVRNCFTYEHGQLAVKNLMNSSKPPTAIICTDNLCLSYTDERYLSEQHYQSPYHTVLGALHQSRKIKVNHSKSISLAYISHYKQSQHNELNSLSCVYKPLYKMGEQAASLLCHQLQKKISPTTTHSLIEAETLFY